MGTRKNLTIGITINLEHYENLRVEVSGEVGNREEADELVGFLDETLKRLGRGDPAIAERVDSYRRRVLTAGTVPAHPDIFDAGHETMQSLPGQENAEISVTARPANQDAAPMDDQSVPEPARSPSEDTGDAENKKEKEVDLPTVSPRERGDEKICESCGNSISVAEQKMSQLFTGKNLCKVCMKKT